MVAAAAPFRARHPHHFYELLVVYICTVSVWLIGQRTRWSSGFDVGVGGGVGVYRASFHAATGKGKQIDFTRASPHRVVASAFSIAANMK